MMPMVRAEPWLKSRWFEAMKEGCWRPSRPFLKTMVGSEQDPRLREVDAIGWDRVELDRGRRGEMRRRDLRQ